MFPAGQLTPYGPFTVRAYPHCTHVWLVWTALYDITTQICRTLYYVLQQQNKWSYNTALRRHIRQLIILNKYTRFNDQMKSSTQAIITNELLNVHNENVRILMNNGGGILVFPCSVRMQSTLTRTAAENVPLVLPTGDVNAKKSCCGKTPYLKCSTAKVHWQT